MVPLWLSCPSVSPVREVPGVHPILSPAAHPISHTQVDESMGWVGARNIHGEVRI